MRYRLICADVMDILSSLPDGCFQGVFCDPPYGLSSKSSRNRGQTDFMGHVWHANETTFDPKLWAEIRRIVVPGGYVLSFGGSRTFHRLACAMEDGGLILNDVLIYMFGTGMDHGLDVSKAIDKAAGAERAVTGPNRWQHMMGSRPKDDTTSVYGRGQTDKRWETAPATPLAARFDGYHSQLKPCYEAIILAQVPMPGSYAQNAEDHGVAGLNIDECRIPYQNSADRDSATPQGKCTSKEIGAIGATPDAGRNLERVEFDRSELKGRFPGNLILGHSPECDEQCTEDCAVRLLDEQAGVRTSGKAARNLEPNNRSGGKKGSVYGISQWEKWHISGAHYPDSGSASRFFYCSKASPTERTAGLEVKTNHPTVKSIPLCKWLSSLIRPPKGDEPTRLLVPFSGVSSEMIGALLAGWDRVVGIEQDADYVRQAEARLKWWVETSEAIGSTDPAEIIKRWRKNMQSLSIGST